MAIELMLGAFKLVDIFVRIEIEIDIEPRSTVFPI